MYRICLNNYLGLYQGCAETEARKSKLDNSGMYQGWSLYLVSYFVARAPPLVCIVSTSRCGEYLIDKRQLFMRVFEHIWYLS